MRTEPHEPIVDVVTVVHCDRNAEQSVLLEKQIAAYADLPYRFHRVDNREENRGFSKGSNLGASWGTAPIILFINPDAEVVDSFFAALRAELSKPGTVIAGERFAKPAVELATWGCDRWVCGACMAVDREWFETVGGFDERYVWSFEDTDLCRQAQAAGLRVHEMRLPVLHRSPDYDTAVDAQYKARHFDQAARLYYRKWRK